MIDVNLVAPILLTRAALPALRQGGDAMVVNIASGIALVGAPFYATYAAAKAGVAGFGESLRRELKGEGVHVLTAFPGGTDTPMMKSNRAGPEIGRAHVCTPVNNAHLVCRLLLEKKKISIQTVKINITINQIQTQHTNKT